MKSAAPWLVAALLLAGCDRSPSTTPAASMPAPPAAQSAPAPASGEEAGAAEPEEVDPAQSRDFVPGSHLGAVHAGTSEKQLKEIYGDKHVERAEWSLGEGEMRAATVVYKDTPHEFWLVWKDDRFEVPERAFIVGSGWRNGAGLQVGTDLPMLVRINGGDFDFLGFDWDYSGAVSSWRTGKLAAYSGKLSVFLERTAAGGDAALEAKVLGDRSVESSEPGLAALGIRVRRIDLGF